MELRNKSFCPKKKGTIFRQGRSVYRLDYAMGQGELRMLTDSI